MNSYLLDQILAAAQERLHALAKERMQKVNARMQAQRNRRQKTWADLFRNQATMVDDGPPFDLGTYLHYATITDADFSLATD